MFAQGMPKTYYYIRSSNSPSIAKYVSRSVSNASSDGLSHNFRSAASNNRSEISRNAHGFDFAKNSRFTSSATYVCVNVSYIQSSIMFVVAS